MYSHNCLLYLEANIWLLMYSLQQGSSAAFLFPLFRVSSPVHKVPLISAGTKLEQKLQIYAMSCSKLKVQEEIDLLVYLSVCLFA